jgi:hypothetical protein
MAEHGRTDPYTQAATLAITARDMLRSSLLQPLEATYSRPSARVPAAGRIGALAVFEATTTSFCASPHLAGCGGVIIRRLCNGDANTAPVAPWLCVAWTDLFRDALAAYAACESLHALSCTEFFGATAASTALSPDAVFADHDTVLAACTRWTRRVEKPSSFVGFP